MPEFVNQILLAVTLISSAGLIYLIYAKDGKRIFSRLFILTLILVIGYIISHSIHFMMVSPGDVTVLDQSCQSFLLMILITLTFFIQYYPDEKKISLATKLFVLIPSGILMFGLWNGYLVEESHLHHAQFAAVYTDYYILFLAWYTILLIFNFVVLAKKIRNSQQIQVKRQFQLVLTGLLITNVTAFIFGLFLPWFLGVYYLVEISPMAFLFGVIIFTALGINKYDLFPSTLEKFNTFSITKKIIFAAIIIVPITILMVQIPLGRLFLNIESSSDWLKYFLFSLFGGLIVSSIMAYVIVRIIANPLLKIKEKAIEIQNGNYGLNVNIDSNDEIGELASTFNSMSGKLKEDVISLNLKEEKIQMLLTAFEKSNAAIAITDNNFNIIEVNQSFCFLTETDKVNVLNEPINKIQFTGSFENYFETIVFELKKLKIFEDTLTGEFGGKERTLLLNVTPFEPGANKPDGYLFVEVDITEIKELEEKLIESEKFASLGKMSAVLAHEIRTPLTSIKMNTDLISESVKEESPDRESLDIIKKEIDRLNGLTNEILLYSREMKLVKTRFLINELIDSILNNINIDIKQKEIKIINKLPGLEIEADRDKLYRVFLNLIINSTEALKEKGEVIIDGYKKENNLFITITDNGSGIDENIKNKIFEPFYTSKSSGTGLGLAICKKMINEHCGEIKLASSKPGKTSFQISIPINN